VEPVDPEDIRAIMVRLMKLDATLERIEHLLELLLEEDDGQEEEEPDA
jgi:hypothetical protein